MVIFIFFIYEFIMKDIIYASLKESIATKTYLLDNEISAIELCGMKLAEHIKNKGKVLLCGNGGSAADAQHLAAELVVRFRSKVNRPAIGAIALTVDPSIMTAGGNDIGFDNVFAREVEAYGNPNDIIIGISTSGNSENVLRALKKAKSMGITTIGLLGGDGGTIKDVCDYMVIVPATTTARIQESHITIGHIWCEIIEEILFKEYITE